MPLTQTELKELADAIFVARLTHSQAHEWDFEPIAQKAFDAAQAFSSVMDQSQAAPRQQQQPQPELTHEAIAQQPGQPPQPPGQPPTGP